MMKSTRSPFPSGSAPRVSVLIPTYNYGHYLAEAIESVLGQDFTDFELIIVDDASSDHSADVIRYFAAADGRIRFHLNPVNHGMVRNWNRCLHEARGEYVKFLFGDDCLASPHALGRMVAMLDGAPRAALAATARLIFDRDSVPVAVWNELRAPGRHDGRRLLVRCLWQDRNLIGEPSAVMFRRLAAANGFDPALHQQVDLEMWLHLLTKGDLVYDPEPLCGFRVHAGQQTVANRSAHVGAEESVMITARYLDALFGRGGAELGAWRRAQLLYRRLHYSRKRARRVPWVEAAEARLGARLSRGWRLGCWGLHRISKPVANVAHCWRKHVRRARRSETLDEALRLWQPPRMSLGET